METPVPITHHQFFDGKEERKEGGSRAPSLGRTEEEGEAFLRSLPRPVKRGGRGEGGIPLYSGGEKGLTSTNFRERKRNDLKLFRSVFLN